MFIVTIHKIQFSMSHCYAILQIPKSGLFNKQKNEKRVKNQGKKPNDVPNEAKILIGHITKCCGKNSHLAIVFISSSSYLSQLNSIIA